jgi:site-specific DNA-methyltransferase (adenine-specific)
MSHRIVFVGNPPYHDFEGAFGSSPISIYQNFVERALDHGGEALLVIPARWYAAGRGLDDFRIHMVSSRKVRQMVDFPIASNVFPSVEIEGGVCFLHVSNTHAGDCSFTDVNGQVHSVNLSKYDIVIRDLCAHTIISKVLSQHTIFMDSSVSGGVPFGMRTNFRSFTEQSATTLPCLTKNGLVYIDRKYVTTGEQMIPQWKTICSNADGAANRIDLDGKKRVLTIIDTIPPSHVCLQTYLVVMATDLEDEARNCTGYLKTKFARFLLGLRKVTQHLSKEKFAWVPKMDFTRPWLDNELYDHFGLTADEQAHIEATIKP